MNENKVDPKEIEKVQKLLSDEEFVKKLISQDTIEDAKKLFENQGIKTSIEEMEMLGRFIKKISEKGNEKLSEEDLEEIVGGKNNEKTLEDIYTMNNISNQIINKHTEVGAISGTFSGASIGAIAGAITMAIVARNDREYIGQAALGGAVMGATLATPIGTLVGSIGGYISGHIKANKFAKKWFNK